MTTVTAIKNWPHPGKITETSSFLQETPEQPGREVCRGDAPGTVPPLSNQSALRNDGKRSNELSIALVPSIFISKCHQLARHGSANAWGVGSTWQHQGL